MNEFIVTNRESVARFFVTSASTIARWHQAGMPGKKGSWDLSEIAQWRISQVQQEAENVLGDAPVDNNDWNMHSGSSSPALERYRAARAGAAELELKKMQESLVDRNIIETELARCSGIMREKLEILDRTPQITGREALNLVLEAFDELDRHLESQKSKAGRHDSKAG